METVKRRDRAKKKERTLSVGILYTLPLTILVSVLLLLLMAYILSKTEDPVALMRPLAYAALGLACLFCGYMSVRLCGKGGVLPAILSGGIYLLLILGTGFLFPSVEGTWLTRLLAFALGVFISVLGGYIAGRRHRTHRRKRRT